MLPNYIQKCLYVAKLAFGKLQCFSKAEGACSLTEHSWMFWLLTQDEDVLSPDGCL